MTDRWSDILDECLKKVGEQWPDPPTVEKPSPEGKAAATHITGILYSGNIHETVPKQLFLDNRLTPLERNGWQVFKMLLDKQGFAAPRYEDLQPYLSMVPYGDKASKETIARVIHILRLTRWLSLINKGRDRKTGQHLGSIYILHDEPITPAEAIQLDSNYLECVMNCCKHANKSVAIVAKGALEDLENSDHKAVQTRLSLLAERIGKQNTSHPDKLYSHKKPSLQKNSPVRNISTPSSETELSQITPVRNKNIPSSETEPSRESPICNEVRNPNSYSTSTVYINSTVLNHPLLKNITVQQRTDLTQLLTNLDTALCNQVLIEFERRCSDGSINYPIGYLFGLLKKAKNNEFKPWLTEHREQQSNNVNQPTQPSSSFYCRDVTKPIPIEAKEQINHLRDLLSSKR